jgi:hypothetical protein
MRRKLVTRAQEGTLVCLRERRDTATPRLRDTASYSSRRKKKKSAIAHP